jgi:hypothetical protein
LINHLPKTIKHAVLVDLDDESSDSLVHDSGFALNTGNQVDDIHQQQLKIEHKHEFNVQEFNYALCLSVPVMVTAKIHGTILHYPCIMVIDNGNWCLRGLLGHKVNLTSLCHDVLVHI